MSLYGREGPVRGYVLASTFKKSSSRLVILVASGALVLSILTCDTCLVAMKDGFFTVSRSPGSISVPLNLLCNAPTRISAITENKYSSSSLCEPFGKRTEWGSQSCGYVRTIWGQSSNFCYVGDDVSAQKKVPDIQSVIDTSSSGQVIHIGFCM